MPEKSGKAKAAPKKAPDNKKMPKNQPSPGKDKPPQKKTPPEKSGGEAALVPYLNVVIALLLAILFVTVCLLDMDQGAGVVGYVIQMFFCSLLGMGAFLLPAALGYIGVRWILFRLKWKNADRSVESEWFHCIYCLLCSGNMRTVDHAAGIISFMFSGIFSDRNCIWNSSYHGCDLHDNGEKHECFRCPGRRCNSCGNLFWRQMFAGFYQCTARKRTDENSFIRKPERHGEGCNSAISNFLNGKQEIGTAATYWNCR